MHFAVILAGGSGTRLWPRSRQLMPKQFLDIIGGRTMLQDAVDRITPLVPPERILVVTNREYLDIVYAQLPELPRVNVIGEIAGRGTAPAIGLAALHVRRLDPDGVMIVLTADHVIAERERFRSALGVATQVAQKGRLVTLGIEAAYPETGYGYIERGDLIGTIDGFDVFRVIRFAEKPSHEKALSFLESGRYSWNSGMFIWRVVDILCEIRHLLPRLHDQLEEIEGSLGTPLAEETLQRVWPGIDKQTIDFGVMERAMDVAVIPVEIGWSDVGSWATLLDLLPADGDGNVLRGNVELVDTHNTLIYSAGRLITAIGLKDMIVVDAGDVILVCPKERAQDVRKLVEHLERGGKGCYTYDRPATLD
jgi:mannose-1-phosphate guanylyltransferase